MVMIVIFLGHAFGSVVMEYLFDETLFRLTDVFDHLLRGEESTRYQ